MEIENKLINDTKVVNCYKPHSVEWIYLTGNVLLNLRALIKKDWGGYFHFANQMGYPKAFINDDLATGKMHRKYIDKFVDTNLLIRECGYYVIPPKELMRVAVYRVQRKYLRLQVWLDHHKIDTYEWRLYSEHDEYNDYITACLKQDECYIENDVYRFVKTQDTNKLFGDYTHARNLFKYKQPPTDFEIQFKDKVRATYGSIENYCRLKGITKRRFNNAFGLILDFKEANIL